jgi:hypothetical protein
MSEELIKDCSICCEKFNKTIRKPLECPKCNHAFCVKCVKRYITSSEADPICMECKGEWTFEFLTESLSKVFMDNDYKQAREKILLDKEIALLPETIPLVELYKQTDEMRKQQDILVYQRLKLSERIADLELEIDTNENILRGHEKLPQRVIKIECPCPTPQCRGFINRESYNCAVCSVYICDMCRDIKKPDEPHICKRESIQTTNLLREDTKACPKCATLIFKIDGCDQMWCTECKTAFSWNTGEIAKGRIHNPHYYEWQRTHGTLQPEDNQCGGLKNFYLYGWKIVSEDFNRSIHRKILELEEETIPQINIEWDNTQLRLDYLLNNITIKEFASRLQNKEKTYRSNVINVDCLRLYCQVVKDMFNSENIDQELELRNYVNETIKKAERLYKVKCVKIKYNMSSVKKLLRRGY